MLALVLTVVGMAESSLVSMPQPLLLSTFSYSGLPCLLLPQVDVSLAFSGAMNLPIPASVRPLTFYAQSAGLLLGELVVSDAYQVRAL